MKTPTSFLAILLLIGSASISLPGHAQQLISPCQVNGFEEVSYAEALYYDLAPARELAAECEQMRARIHRMTGGPAPRLSQADIRYMNRCKARIKKMEAEVESMRQGMTRRYTLLSNSSLTTQDLLDATESELEFMMTKPVRTDFSRGIASL